MTSEPKDTQEQIRTMRLLPSLLPASLVSSRAIKEKPTKISSREFTYDANTINCNQSSILTTPTYGTKGAIFTICSSILINAPVSVIYETIIDFRRYGEWNSFVVSVDVPANVSTAQDVYIGMPMTFKSAGLIPGMETSSKEVITGLNPQQAPGIASAVWKYDDSVNGYFQRAEHISLVREKEAGVREYVSWETYYGPGAVVVGGLLKANLQEAFERQGRDLKARVEG